ncbi:uncharacterized protein [Littorina saxatilis]|uniref:uncharacterized protein n=1 Tax=Littorina saxatilis TaxID=31220 RepID=UPI0038B66552
MVGGALCATGCVIAFLATNIAHVVIGLGAVTGKGLTVICVTQARTVAGVTFHDKRSLALSAVSISAAAGTALFPQLLRHVTNQLSLRGTCLVLASINCQVVVVGALLGLFLPRPARRQRPASTSLPAHVMTHHTGDVMPLHVTNDTQDDVTPRPTDDASLPLPITCDTHDDVTPRPTDDASLPLHVTHDVKVKATEEKGREGCPRQQDSAEDGGCTTDGCQDLARTAWPRESMPTEDPHVRRHDAFGGKQSVCQGDAGEVKTREKGGAEAVRHYQAGMSLVSPDCSDHRETRPDSHQDLDDCSDHREARPVSHQDLDDCSDHRETRPDSHQDLDDCSDHRETRPDSHQDLDDCSDHRETRTDSHQDLDDCSDHREARSDSHQDLDDCSDHRETRPVSHQDLDDCSDHRETRPDSHQDLDDCSDHRETRPDSHQDLDDCSDHSRETRLDSHREQTARLLSGHEPSLEDRTSDTYSQKEDSNSVNVNRLDTSKRHRENLCWGMWCRRICCACAEPLNCSNRIRGRSYLQLDIAREPRFVLFSLLGITALLFFIQPSVFLTDLARSDRMSVQQGSLCISVIFAGNVGGRVLAGVLYRLLPPAVLVVHSVSIATGGVTCLGFLVASEFPHFVAVSLIFGLSLGVFTATIPMSFLEILGPARFTLGLGYASFLGGLALLIAGPLGGFIRDVSGSYRPMFYIAAVQGALAGSVLLFTALRYRH